MQTLTFLVAVTVAAAALTLVVATDDFDATNTTTLTSSTTLPTTTGTTATSSTTLPTTTTTTTASSTTTTATSTTLTTPATTTAAPASSSTTAAPPTPSNNNKGKFPLCSALAVIQGAIDYILPTGVRSHIVVLDAGGNKIATARMDGTVNLADGLAFQKARTTIMLGIPSGASFGPSGLIPDSYRFPFFDPEAVLFHTDEQMWLSGLGGAFPIHDADGTLIAVLGVSGAPTAQQDILAAKAGLARKDDCVQTLNIDAIKLPRLADAVERLSRMIPAANARNQKEGFAFLDDMNREVFFAAMDGGGLLSNTFAAKKARSAMLLGFNTSAELYDRKIFSPGSKWFTVDATNGGLTMAGGGIVIRDAAGNPVGSFGVSGAPSADIDVEIMNEGLGAASFSATPTLSLETTYAIMQAALDKAFEINAACSVAIVDPAGDVRMLFTSHWTSPGADKISVAKAFSAVALPYPHDFVEGLCRAPNPDLPLVNYTGAYNLANARNTPNSPGLVFYSGSSPITDASGTVIGGIGVYSEQNFTFDNAIVAAGVAAKDKTLSPGDFNPPKFTKDQREYLMTPVYATYNPALSAAGCLSAAGSVAQLRKIACFTRANHGEPNFIVVGEQAPRGMLDLAKGLSYFAYIYPAPGSFLQPEINPFNGSSFTTHNAFPPYSPMIAAPGSCPIIYGDYAIGSVGVAGYNNDITQADIVAYEVAKYVAAGLPTTTTQAPGSTTQATATGATTTGSPAGPTAATTSSAPNTPTTTTQAGGGGNNNNAGKNTDDDKDSDSGKVAIGALIGAAAGALVVGLVVGFLIGRRPAKSAADHSDAVSIGAYVNDNQHDA